MKFSVVWINGYCGVFEISNSIICKLNFLSKSVLGWCSFVVVDSELCS